MRPTDYKTRQKEAILSFFKENSNRHLTAADIINQINSTGENIGTATVYRYLDRLVEKGTIRKYFVDEKLGACYQYNEDNRECGHHFHLKCIECGKLIHLDCSHLQSISDHIFSEHDFVIDNSRTVFYGRCKNCEK